MEGGGEAVGGDDVDAGQPRVCVAQVEDPVVQAEVLGQQLDRREVPAGEDRSQAPLVRLPGDQHAGIAVGAVQQPLRHWAAFFGPGSSRGPGVKPRRAVPMSPR